MVFAVYLSAAAWQDAKRRELSGWLFAIFFAVFLGFWLCFRLSLIPRNALVLLLSQGMARDAAFWELAGGMMVGIVLLMVCRITRGGIGAGDGWFFLVSGVYLGFRRNLLFLTAALCLCSAGGLIVFMAGRLQKQDWRKKTLPLMVFALIPGMLIIW